jgi:uncharacterized protein with PIN domain
MKTLKQHNEEIMRRYVMESAGGAWMNNGIECPECGVELRDVESEVVLTSMPPKRRVSCPGCGFGGMRLC